MTYLYIFKYTTNLSIFCINFHHRGAFYVEEDELEMDKNDCRNRGTEYSSARMAKKVIFTLANKISITK